MKVSNETIDILFQFDELNALEKLVERDEFYTELMKIEQTIKKRLEVFSKNFWNAQWSAKI